MAQSTESTILHVDAAYLISVLFFVLIATQVFFVFADVVINVGGLIELDPIRRFFNITREDGVASWFATTQTWMVGITAAFLYVVVRAGDADRWRKFGWAFIAMFLLYMAMDDGSEFHERIGSSVKFVLQGPNAAGEWRQPGYFPSYTWQLVFLPVFATFGLFLLWFLNKELRVARDKLLVVVAIGLLVLAVIADFFEGLAIEHPLNLHAWIMKTWELSTYQVRHYAKSLEEFMEMLSMTLLWVVFLRHLVHIAPEIRLRFRNLPH